MKNTYPEISDMLPAALRGPENGGNGNSGHVLSGTRDIFHIIAENTSDLIIHYQYKPVNRMAYVSPSFARITGYTPEEYYADPGLPRKCIHPDDQKALNYFINPDASQGQEPVALRWIHKDGRVIWIEPTKTVIRDESGEVTDVYYIARDITRHKLADDALRESQKFNASLLEHAPHAKVVINPDTSIRYVNPAWERVNGWTLAEVVGMKAPYPWWPEENKQVFLNSFKEAMKQGKGKAEVIAQKKNGELYWIEMDWDSVTNNGELQYLLINSTDITERLKAQEKQQAIIKTALDGFWTCNMDGKLLEVNDSYCKMIGYTREELLKMSIQDIEAVESAEQTARRIGKIIEEGYDRFETQHKRKDGKVIDIEISVNYSDINEGQMYVFVRDITERKQAEIKTRQSEQRYRLLAENVTDVIWTVDINNPAQLNYISPSVARLLDLSVEEAMARQMAEIFTPASFETCMKVLAEEMSLERSEQKDPFRSRTLDLEFYRKDGTIVPVEIKCSLIRDADSRPVEILVVGRDITGRKRAEKALANEAIRRRILVEQSRDGIVILDQNGKVIDANRRFAEMLGYSVEEALQLSVWDWEYQYPHEQVVEMIGTVDENGDHFETRHRRKDGSIYDVEISTNGAAFEGQKLIFCVCRDITQRKQAEEALRISEEKFRNLFEHAKDAVILADTQTGNIVHVNTAGCTLLGLPKEKIIGMHQSKIHLQESVEKGTQLFQDHVEKGVAFTEDIIIQRADGVKVPVDISASVVKMADKSIIQGVFRDITERKQMEKALRESEAMFSTAFRSSPELMTIVNLKDGKYVKVNDTFCHFLGYTREELIGHSAAEFNLWVNPEEETRMVRLMENQGKVRHEEYHFRTKSGETRTWLCSVDTISIGGESHMLAVATDITERKKAQEALQESEEKFSKAFHANPISISISRLEDGKFIEVNDSFLRDKGYTREEVIGHNSAELNIWAEPGMREKIIKTLKERGRVHNEPCRFRTKSGYVRTGLISAELISIGNEPCMITLNNDITQQKLAEERLRLLSSVTQQVSDSTIVTDRNFKITYMNKAAQDLLGYSAEESLGKGLELFNAEPVPKEVTRKIFQTVASGKVWSSTVPKRRKDGRIIYCESRVSPLYDEKGQVSSFIDVQRDVTEQKQMEAKLQEHKQLIESILAAMPEGVLVIDGNDRILLANEAFYKIFHRGKKSTISKLLGETIHIDQLVNLYRAVKRGEGNDNTLEFRYRVRDLEKIINCVVVKMDGDCTLLTFIDISREREEEEKLYLTDRLASIGEMAAGLAHELNNPLTGIMALSQLLVDSDISGEYKEDLQSIHSEAKRAASIVKNVLLFARNNTYENGQSSVNDVIRDVLRLREHEEKVSNIKVVTNFEENLPEITIDKYQLQQVFLNIILNAEAAIKEANRPGILTVTTERSNNHVSIVFKDNGCGIKKHIMPRIFDPFFTTKEIGKGTGLGLSICYSIVVKHGGKISVRSQVNEGSTFTIKIPVIN